MALATAGKTWGLTARTIARQLSKSSGKPRPAMVPLLEATSWRRAASISLTTIDVAGVTLLEAKADITVLPMAPAPTTAIALLTNQDSDGRLSLAIVPAAEYVGWAARFGRAAFLAKKQADSRYFDRSSLVDDGPGVLVQPDECLEGTKQGR